MSKPLKEILKEVTFEILETMFFALPEPWEEEVLEGDGIHFDIRAFIPLGGPHRIVLNLFLPKALARVLAAGFLGMEEEEVDDDALLDTSREMLNMIGGNFVNRVGVEAGLETGLPEAVFDARFMPRASLATTKNLLVLLEEQCMMLAFSKESSNG